MALRGQRIWPGAKLLAAIAAGGLLGQVGGNVSFQWSLDKVGVALAVSLCLGGMILSAAVMGRIFLAEPVTPRTTVALSLLLLAIVVLGIGADDAARSVAETRRPVWLIAAGASAACGSGGVRVRSSHHQFRGGGL